MEDIIGALLWDIIRVLVMLPQETVATESRIVMLGADVVVDAGGHAYGPYLTGLSHCCYRTRPKGGKVYLGKIFVLGMARIPSLGLQNKGRPSDTCESKAS